MIKKLISISPQSIEEGQTVQQKISSIETNSRTLLEHPIFSTLNDISSRLSSKNIEFDYIIFGSTVYKLLAEFQTRENETIEQSKNRLFDEIYDLDVIFITSKNDSDTIENELKSNNFKKHNTFSTIITDATELEKNSSSKNKQSRQRVSTGIHFAYNDSETNVNTGLSIIYKEHFNPLRHASSIAEALYIRVLDDKKSVEIKCFIDSPEMALTHYSEKILDHPGNVSINIAFRVPKSEVKGMRLTKRMNKLVQDSFNETYISYGLKSSLVHGTLFQQVSVLYENYCKNKSSNDLLSLEIKQNKTRNIESFKELVVDPYLQRMGYAIARLKKNSVDDLIQEQIIDRAVNVIYTFFQSSFSTSSDINEESLKTQLSVQIEKATILQTDIPNLIDKKIKKPISLSSNKKHYSIHYSGYIDLQFKKLSSCVDPSSIESYRSLFNNINEGRELIPKEEAEQFEHYFCEKLFKNLINTSNNSKKDKNIEKVIKAIINTENPPLANSKSISSFVIKLLTIIKTNPEIKLQSKSILTGTIWSLALLSATKGEQSQLVQLAKSTTFSDGSNTWENLLSNSTKLISVKAAEVMVGIQLNILSNLSSIALNEIEIADIVEKHDLSKLKNDVFLKNYASLLCNTIKELEENTVIENENTLFSNQYLGQALNQLRVLTELWGSSKNEKIVKEIDIFKLNIVESAKPLFYGFDNVITYIKLMQSFSELNNSEFLEIIVLPLKTEPGILCDPLFWSEVEKIQDSNPIISVIASDLDSYIPYKNDNFRALKQCYERATNQEKAKMATHLLTKRTNWLVKNQTEKNKRIPSIPLGRDLLKDTHEKTKFPKTLNHILSENFDIHIKLTWLFILSEIYQQDLNNTKKHWNDAIRIIENLLTNLSIEHEFHELFLTFYESKTKEDKLKILNQVEHFLKEIHSSKDINWKNFGPLYEFASKNGNSYCLSEFVKRTSFQGLINCFEKTTKKSQAFILKTIVESNETCKMKLDFISHVSVQESSDPQIMCTYILKLNLSEDESERIWENYFELLHIVSLSLTQNKKPILNEKNEIIYDNLISILTSCNLTLEDASSLIQKLSLSNFDAIWKFHSDPTNPLYLDEWITICFSSKTSTQYRANIIKSVINSHNPSNIGIHKQWQAVWNHCEDQSTETFQIVMKDLGQSVFSEFIYELKNDLTKIKLLCIESQNEKVQSNKKTPILIKTLKNLWEVKKEYVSEKEINSLKYFLEYILTSSSPEPTLITLMENLDDEKDTILYENFINFLKTYVHIVVINMALYQKNSSNQNFVHQLINQSKNNLLKTTLTHFPKLASPSDLLFFAVSSLNSETLQIILEHKHNVNIKITSNPSFLKTHTKKSPTILDDTPFIGLMDVLLAIQFYIKSSEENSKKLKDILTILMDHSINLNVHKAGTSNPLLMSFYTKLKNDQMLTLEDILEHKNVESCADFVKQFIHDICNKLQTPSTEIDLKLLTFLINWVEKNIKTKVGRKSALFLIENQTDTNRQNKFLNYFISTSNWNNIFTICNIYKECGIPVGEIFTSSSLTFYEPMPIYEKIQNILPIKVDSEESLTHYKNFIKKFNVTLDIGTPILCAIAGPKNKAIQRKLGAYLIEKNISLDDAINIVHSYNNQRISRFLSAAWLNIFYGSYDIFGSHFEKFHPENGRYNLLCPPPSSLDPKRKEKLDENNFLYAAIEAKNRDYIEKMLIYICDSETKTNPFYVNALTKLLIDIHPIYLKSAWRLIKDHHNNLFLKYKTLITEIFSKYLDSTDLHSIIDINEI
ncbi:hypothetical protein HOG98_05055 [bacterium]|jgi:hypothetical protein|nr:hypothetical protein [bacterium]